MPRAPASGQALLFDTGMGIGDVDTGFTRENARNTRRQEAQAEIAAGQICGDLPAGFDRAAYAIHPWNTPPPGHTPDSIALFDRDHGLLFTGDTYYRGTIWLYSPETSLDHYGESIRRLAAPAKSRPTRDRKANYGIRWGRFPS